MGRIELLHSFYPSLILQVLKISKIKKSKIKNSTETGYSFKNLKTEGYPKQGLTL